MEVPLENQTKESLIAYIQSLEKQAEQDKERRRVLEALWQAVKRDASKIATDYRHHTITVYSAFQGAYFALNAMDAAAQEAKK